MMPRNTTFTVLSSLFCFLGVTGTSLFLLAAPGDFTHYLSLVQSLQLGSVLLVAMKYILAFPVTYHYINGIRHLVSTSRK